MAVAVAAAWLASASASVASASVVAFDSFGPADSAGALNYGVDGNTDFQAFHFISAATGALESISVAVGRMENGGRQTQFDLFDGTGNALGNLLESQIIINIANPGPVVITFNSLLGPLLTAGQDYWLSVTEPDVADGSTSKWFFNNQGLADGRITTAQSVTSATLPAFRVVVADVPEPATVALFGVALAGFVVVRRRRLG